MLKMYRILGKQYDRTGPVGLYERPNVYFRFMNSPTGIMLTTRLTTRRLKWVEENPSNSFLFSTFKCSSKENVFERLSKQDKIDFMFNADLFDYWEPESNYYSSLTSWQSPAEFGFSRINWWKFKKKKLIVRLDYNSESVTMQKLRCTNE